MSCPVQFSHSVVSDSLQPHGLHHARLPCASVSPRICSDSCLLSWWCHPTISSSVVPFSPYPQSFLASGSLPVNQLFASGGQSIWASASVLPMNIQNWFPLGLTGLISFQLVNSQKSSSAPRFESINSLVLSLFYGSTFTFVHDYWKNHSFDSMDLCQQNDVSGF